MKKDLILVIFSTYNRAEWFYEDNIKPVMSYLKKVNNMTYESDTYILRLCSLSNPNNLRGYNANFIYLSDECSLKIYNEIVLPLVKNRHECIKVVM